MIILDIDNWNKLINISNHSPELLQTSGNYLNNNIGEKYHGGISSEHKDKFPSDLKNNIDYDCTHPFLNKHKFIGGVKVDLMKEALLDPGHNLKEVAEQLILLEDHLAHPRRRCRDCITKHYLTIEAFLREAITLDKEQKYFDEIEDLLNTIKPAMIQLLQKIEKGKPTNKEYLDTCQILRENRKKIMIKYALRN
jgi:hypothetical protein